MFGRAKCEADLAAQVELVKAAEGALAAAEANLRTAAEALKRSRAVQAASGSLELARGALGPEIFGE